MNDYKIYLSGKITGLERDYAYLWRQEIKEYYEKRIKGIYDWLPNIKIYNPVEVFGFVENNPVNGYIIDDKYIMRRDLQELRSSDLVVCYTDDIGTSIGTCIELGIAHERRIPIIGLAEEKDITHPWVNSIIDISADTITCMWELIVNYYIPQ